MKSARGAFLESGGESGKGRTLALGSPSAWLSQHTWGTLRMPVCKRLAPPLQSPHLTCNSSPPQVTIYDSKRAERPCSHVLAYPKRVRSVSLPTPQPWVFLFYQESSSEDKPKAAQKNPMQFEIMECWRPEFKLTRLWYVFQEYRLDVARRWPWLLHNIEESAQCQGQVSQVLSQKCRFSLSLLLKLSHSHS